MSGGAVTYGRGSLQMEPASAAQARSDVWDLVSSLASPAAWVWWTLKEGDGQPESCNGAGLRPGATPSHLHRPRFFAGLRFKGST